MKHFFLPKGKNGHLWLPGRALAFVYVFSPADLLVYFLSFWFNMLYQHNPTQTDHVFETPSGMYWRNEGRKQEGVLGSAIMVLQLKLPYDQSLQPKKLHDAINQHLWRSQLWCIFNQVATMNASSCQTSSSMECNAIKAWTKTLKPLTVWHVWHSSRFSKFKVKSKQSLRLK